MKFEKVMQATANAFVDKYCDGRQEYVDLTNLNLPCRSTARAGGYDFFLPFAVEIKPNSTLLIPTFVKAQLDADKILEMYPRSSYGVKYGLMLANTVGIIDADYYNNADNEGHIMICLRNMSDKEVKLEAGSRFCQGVIKQFFLVDGDEYGVGMERTGGFGSSGK